MNEIKNSSGVIKFIKFLNVFVDAIAENMLEI